MEETKCCTCCSQEYPLSHFYRERSKGPDVRRSICKACAKDKARGWKQANPSRHNESYRKWAGKNKRHLKEYHLKTTYGLTLEDYFKRLEEQEHRCSICKVHHDDHKEFFHVDHCHSKGHVRTLLCRLCNVGLGHFRDSPELLRRAADYLEDHSDGRKQDGAAADRPEEEGTRETAEV